MNSRDVRLGLLLFGAAAAAFLFPALAGKTHFAGDALYSFHPWLSYAAQELQAGRFPLWNPYSAGGEPFSANPQTMLFLPAAQLFWLFPFPRAWGAFLLVNHALLWAAVYLAAKRWTGRRGAAALAATALAWSGFVTVLWEFPSAVATLALAPLAALFAADRRTVPLAVCVALLAFAGYVPFALYALLLAAGLLAAKTAAGGGRRAAAGAWVAFAVAAAGGLALAACQALPSWEAARGSIRAAIGAEEARAHVLPPALLLKLLFPEIIDKVALAFSEPAFGAGHWPVQRNWLTTFFIGTAPLLLGTAALLPPKRPRAVLWAAAALLSAAVACGVEPFFSLFRALPGMGFLTHFSNAMWIGLAALAFAASDAAADPAGRRKALRVLFAAAGAAAAALALWPRAREACLSAMLGAASLSEVQHAFVARAGWAGLASLAAAALALRLPKAPRAAALCLLTAGELWIFQRGLHPWTDGAFFEAPASLVSTLRERGGRFAVHPKTLQGGKPMAGGTLEEGYQSLRQALYPNVQLPFRIRSPWGYEVAPARKFAEFRRAAVVSFPSPATDFLSIRQVLTTEPLPAPAKLLARAPNALLYDAGAALPAVTWTSRAVVLPGGKERLDYLSGAWSPGREVVLESAAPSSGAAQGRAEESAGSPGRAAARGRGQGFVVRNEVFHPGWEVFVNGGREALLRANHAFQAAATPEGLWEAVFLYRPKSFRLGLAVTLGAAAALAFAAARRLRKFKTA